jgi:hypothetical protein
MPASKFCVTDEISARFPPQPTQVTMSPVILPAIVPHLQTAGMMVSADMNDTIFVEIERLHRPAAGVDEGLERLDLAFSRMTAAATAPRTLENELF